MTGTLATIRRDVRLGLSNLLLHKLRSLLTMLGLVFGTGSVIAMLAVGEGASEAALAEIRKLGSRNVIIRSEQPADDKSMAESNTHFATLRYGITYQDATSIRETIPCLSHVVPAKEFRRLGRFRARALDVRTIATTEDWFAVLERPVIAGRVLTSRDLEARANVAVLTEFGVHRLLATDHAIGETITLGGVSYQVVGVVRNEEASDGGADLPDAQTDVYIPLTTARQRYGDVIIEDSSHSSSVEAIQLAQIIVQVAHEEDVERVAAAITRVFESAHKKKDYAIAIPLALLRQAERTKRTFSIVLGAIAAISLLVGGIGIMNIMLANVTERTREIGIRRAIGARRSRIVMQFLVESSVLSALGGLVGVVLGLGLPLAVTLVAKMPTSVTPWSVIVSFGISLVTGIAFALYPAVRAAALDPVIALRHDS